MSKEKLVPCSQKAAKKYKRIASEHHGEDVTISVGKEIWLHRTGYLTIKANIWCSHCHNDNNLHETVQSFLEAHNATSE